MDGPFKLEGLVLRRERENLNTNWTLGDITILRALGLVENISQVSMQL